MRLQAGAIGCRAACQQRALAPNELVTRGLSGAAVYLKKGKIRHIAETRANWALDACQKSES